MYTQVQCNDVDISPQIIPSLIPPHSCPQLSGSPKGNFVVHVKTHQIPKITDYVISFQRYQFCKREMCVCVCVFVEFIFSAKILKLCSVCLMTSIFLKEVGDGHSRGKIKPMNLKTGSMKLCKLKYKQKKRVGKK